MFLKRNKTYSISFDSEDFITPEETLLDSGSQYSDIEKSIQKSIFQHFLIIFNLLMIVLAGFTFKITILDHETYASWSLQNKSSNFPLPPPRGLITDRTGLPLVQDETVFNLLAITRELKGIQEEEFDKQNKNVASILGEPDSEFKQYLIEEMKSNATFIAYSNLTKDQALAIKYTGPAGFYVVPTVERFYVDGHKLSQIIGYTGKVSKNDLSDEYYYPTDKIGRLGIENQYEKYIRGTHGNIFFSRESDNLVTKEPKPGNTLKLNIDHDLQIKFYDEIFGILRESGLSRAAGVIQNPQNGEVLSLVSFPDFDNNIFSSQVSRNDYVRLFESSSKPLFNRAISGLYNPGSTIKPLMGMAALQEKIVTPNDTITDCVSLTIANQYDSSTFYTFKNWRAEYGQFDLKKAIANSCNIYFFTVGGGFGNIKGLGAERIASYLKKSLADSKTGIDIPGESAGFVPTPDWKLREKGEPWYLGDTYNTSIGQGDLLVTPLWLNTYVSAIANGGTMYKPKVAQAILGEGNTLISEIKPEVIGKLPFSESVINQMKLAMRETVVSGTAQIFNQLPVTGAAKTGTAEVIKGKSINSLFTIFLPLDNPKIALTLLVEGSASNQGLAIRAAYNTLKWYFEQ